jgi:hypothetical protein
MNINVDTGKFGNILDIISVLKPLLTNKQIMFIVEWLGVKADKQIPVGIWFEKLTVIHTGSAHDVMASLNPGCYHFIGPL